MKVESYLQTLISDLRIRTEGENKSLKSKQNFDYAGDKVLAEIGQRVVVFLRIGQFLAKIEQRFRRTLEIEKFIAKIGHRFRKTLKIWKFLIEIE